MALAFAEGLIDEISTYLAANLPAKLDAIETAIGDSITLDDPTAYLRRDPSSSPRSAPELPLMFLVVPRTTIVAWHETSAEQNHQLWIYLIARDNDAETLRKKMYRYARGIWETLVDHQFDTATWKAGIGAPPVFDFSPTMTNGNIVTADVRVEVQYEKLETE